jgi:hypothetical protein
MSPPSSAGRSWRRGAHNRLIEDIDLRPGAAAVLADPVIFRNVDLLLDRLQVITLGDRPNRVAGRSRKR